MRSELWRNAAAFGTWLVVGLPTIAAIAAGRFGGTEAILWGVAFAAFGAALLPCLGVCLTTERRGRLTALLVVQALAGLAMVYLSGNATAGATLVIVAAEVAGQRGAHATWTWVAVQSAAFALVTLRLGTFVEALSVAGAFAGFQAFAVSTVSLAERERAAREELARANAELLATRSLLAEHSRVSERLRIARDLHDTLGHHLTALTLQLDVAARLASPQAAGHVQEAHALTKLLLSDVRSVVSELRESSGLDLAAALRALAGGAAGPAVHLEMPAALAVDDVAQAHALLRCVQEIITNAARHAAARNLWIRIEPTPAGIDLHARDDGRGTAQVKWGNGLRGMRERFEEFAGRVEFSSGEGRGFEVHGFMPRAEAAS